MKLKDNETVATEVGTYIGTLTWIDWEHNRGKALLDPKPGDAPVEVDCTFRFAGQHWVWNMDSYPEEDIASHSAFAFCHGDRVILLHPAPAKKIKDSRGNLVADPDSPRYAAVAVLKESDDGKGGKTVTLDKRKVWPLYRLEHEAVVLNYKYTGLAGRGSGFPFITDDGKRTLVGEFLDQRGHKRAFGTPESEGGTGNPRLVVTRERGRPTSFVPHAIHEFCEADENIPYVPDVLMQTAPNYRGRIIGWSERNEVLIDNIPVAGVSGAMDDLEKIMPSWKAVTRTFLHVDEQHNVLTVLLVTMDCNFDWRPRERSGTPGGSAEYNWYPPQYAFHVQSGSVQLDELCIYAAMETPRDELPQIVMRVDAAASWLWQDVQRQEPKLILNNQPDNMSEGVEIAYPGHEAEMFFWGGVIFDGTAQPGQRRKISLVITSNDDGSIKIEKRLGEPELFAAFDEDNLTSYVRHATRTYTDSEGRTVNKRYIAEDYASINGVVYAEAARLNNTSLSVGVYGADSYRVGQSTGWATYDTNLYKVYRHRGPGGDFQIAEERQLLNGRNVAFAERQAEENYYDDVRATMTMIVFTRIDLRNGIYGYWDVTLLDDVRCRDILPYGGSDTGKSVRWSHYVRSRDSVVYTHSWERAIPFGDGNDNSVITNLAPLTRLVSFLYLNNPGTPGFFDPRTHYCHNIWNLPRFLVDDVELRPDMNVLNGIDYKDYIFAPRFYSRAIENDIFSWLQGTTHLHGTRRKPVTMAKSGLYNFNLSPIPTKDIGMWPYYRNVCMGYGDDFLVSPSFVDTSRMLGGILYSDCMKYTGTAYGFGEFDYTVEFNRNDGGNTYPSPCVSSGMDSLRRCTGRDDAIISID